jgi:hypothetical protein
MKRVQSFSYYSVIVESLAGNLPALRMRMRSLCVIRQTKVVTVVLS